MPGFFNQEDPWRAKLQQCNAIAIAIASLRLFCQQQANPAELGADIAVRAFTIYSLGANPPILIEMASALLNAYCARGITSGFSSTTAGLRTLNALGHAIYAVESIDPSYTDSPKL